MILLGAYSKTSTEFRYIPANNPNAEWKIILPRQNGSRIRRRSSRRSFLHSHQQRREELPRRDRAGLDPSEKNWKEFVAHRPAVKIEGIDLFADHAVLSEWENGLQQLEVVDFKTNKRHRIKFPEPVYAAGLTSNREFNTTVVRYNYQSLVTPSSVFDYDMNTRQVDADETDGSAGRL